MPPRFAYWTIIVDGGATSFRAKEREELEPTLKQLRKKSPDAVLRWFSGGRIWRSPEEARAARFQEQESQADKVWREAIDGLRRARLAREGEAGRGEPRPEGQARESPAEPERRPVDHAKRREADRPAEERRRKDWRPGGDHRDPRDRYKGEPGERRARWKARTFGKKPGGGFWKPKPPGDAIPPPEAGDRQDRRPGAPRTFAPRGDSARGPGGFRGKGPGGPKSAGNRPAGPRGPQNPRFERNSSKGPRRGPGRPR